MKKQLIAIGILIVVLIALVIGFGIYGGNDEVKFEDVQANDLPRELETEIIPQYRNLERALACRVEDEIYVLAMRGEKPTSGYEIKITELQLKMKNKRQN